MLEKGEILTSPKLERFLSEQTEIRRFIFIVKKENGDSEKRELQNNDDSYRYIEENKSALFEFESGLA